MSKDLIVKILNALVYYNSAKRYNLIAKQYNKRFVASLTRTEKKQIKALWEPINSRGINLYRWHQFYKACCGYFDERFVPSTIYNGLLEYTMNQRKFSSFLQHKGEFHLFIKPEHRCKTIFSNINEKLYDDEMDLLTKSKALQILHERKDDMIVVKPSIGSGGGRGVRMLSKKDITLSNFDEILGTTDYIVQDVLHEGEDLRRFNRDTVNTIRLLSLNLNGRVSVLSAFLRMGAKGMLVDNVSSGGIFVGIKSDGYLHDYALDKGLNKTYISPSGMVFKDVYLSSYSSICDFAMRHHKDFPLANLIAWDFAIDEKNNVIVLEINLDSGDVHWHQMFNGPLFGDRTEEVIDYVLAHPVRRFIIK